MTAYYTPIFGPTGFTAPDTATILAGVQADINSAFGGTLNPALNTPQGQIASSLAAIIADKNNTFLFYSSQTDPQYAEGRMQDAIGQIYFMQRIPAQGTIVTCTCTGLQGTVIPANARVQDTAGSIYSCASGGTIPLSGSIDLVFQNIVVGAIPCLSGTVTQIYNSITGWSGVTNASGTDIDPTLLGRTVETQQEFEYRRQQSVALNSVGMIQSIYASVAASGPPNPTDVFVTDNPLGIPALVGGVTLAAHSVYVAVVGGDPLSIATAIWNKKMPGCNYNGATNHVVYDYNYTPPVPYTIYWTTPSNLLIYFTVNLVDNGNLPSDIVTQVQNAIVSAFTGGDGGAPQRIGGTVYASRFYIPVINLSPYVQIITLFVDTAPTPITGDSVAVNLDQFPVTITANVSVNLV